MEKKLEIPALPEWMSKMIKHVEIILDVSELLITKGMCCDKHDQQFEGKDLDSIMFYFERKNNLDRKLAKTLYGVIKEEFKASKTHELIHVLGAPAHLSVFYRPLSPNKIPACLLEKEPPLQRQSSTYCDDSDSSEDTVKDFGNEGFSW